MRRSWEAFEYLAGKYDAWFETERGRAIFRAEVDCISCLLSVLSRPWLEIGVGTGRFAAALGIDEGVDPSPAVLEYAGRRGIRTRIGSAEQLSYESGVFGATFLIVTICFLTEPVPALNECVRVLKSNGYLIIGLVPKDSPWGKEYLRKGAQGHPFYSAATFYTSGEIIELAGKAGFVLDRTASCLFEDPGEKVNAYCRPREGIVKGAGFVGLRFALRKKSVGKQVGAGLTRILAGSQTAELKRR